MQGKEQTPIKQTLHPRNKNRQPYDLTTLVQLVPALKNHIKNNKFGLPSVDFAHPQAVKLLNTALLKQNYGLVFWDFPHQNLCPPVPGRADYLHYIADLLASVNQSQIPQGDKVVGLDIGTGATCIYPIIGTCEYGWQFIASDINENSVASSTQIIDKNPDTMKLIEIRHQTQPKHFFKTIIRPGEIVDFTLCNPPFHANSDEAEKGTRRKTKNLTGKNSKTTLLNFSGANNELIYEGGEINFIQKMITESVQFSKQCLWFTTMVSKETNLPKISTLLKKLNVQDVRIIPMTTGNKVTRIIAWTFQTDEEQKKWVKKRWL